MANLDIVALKAAVLAKFKRGEKTLRQRLEDIIDSTFNRTDDAGGGGGLTLGETNVTAYRGDRGKTAYDHSQAAHETPGAAAAALTSANGYTDSEIAALDAAIAILLAAKADALGADDNYVTDAEKVKLANLSGTNTGDQTSVSGNAGSATVLQNSRQIDGVDFNGSASIAVIAPGTHAAPSKATPVDADEMPLVDSAASNVLKRLTWANLKATLKSYYDTLYAAALGSDDNYVTDAEKTKLANLSGTNSGDQDLSGLMVKANNLSDLVNAATARGNLGGTTVGQALFLLANPGAIRFLRVNADNTVTARTAAEFLADIGAQAAGTYLVAGNNLSDITNAGTARGNLGGTTVGQAIFLLTNPSAIRFLKINADNTVSTRTAAEMLADLGATTVGANLVALANPSAVTFIRINADNTITARTAAQMIGDLGGLTAANIVATITNGNTTTAPSEDAVFDALTNKGQVNSAEFSQLVVSGTAYYITGSAINIPVSTLQVGSSFRWRIWMTKTAAGTGTFQMRIYRGTNGTTGDTADVTQTLGTQTAVVDSMVVDVTIYVTTTGGTGAYFWTICPMNKAATATGFGIATGTTGLFSGTVSAVALNTANLKLGLSFIATTGTPTVRVVQIEKMS